MAHWAKVVNGEVVKCIVADEEFFDTFVDTAPGRWVKTSYNMLGGVHYDPSTNEPSADQSIITGDEARQRKNYGGLGMKYDVTADAFYSPQPYPSWTLNTTTYLWESPIDYPTDGALYSWNEETQSWDVVEVVEEE